MGTFLKKGGIVLLVALLSVFMAVPALSFANVDTAVEKSVTGLMEPAEAEQLANSDTADADGAADEGEQTPADDCTATIQYVANPYAEEPSKPADETGRVVLGTLEVTGLREGDVLHAWDYVVDIPGHFFFDGWPLDLTVSRDPAQNVMKLIYVKLWNSEYTVNYYVMTGADLTADNWHDALATGNVEFHKIGSEKFENQLFDSVVHGDAYEYRIDGAYVIDTYPAQIRLTEDPDDNVLNVLYASAPTDRPDGAEPPDSPPADEGSPDDDGANSGGAGENGSGSASGDTTTLPGDTSFGKDGIAGVLPDGDEIYEDFIGSDVGAGELVITDEMLANPVDKEQALMTARAYQTGLQQASHLAQTGDGLPWIIGGLVVVAALAVIGIVMATRRRATAAVVTDDSDSRNS